MGGGAAASQEVGLIFVTTHYPMLLLADEGGGWRWSFFEEAIRPGKKKGYFGVRRLSFGVGSWR